MVYKDKSWKINFRPWFWKEILALLSNKSFKNKKELRIANYYRLYVLGFIILVTIYNNVEKIIS